MVLPPSTSVAAILLINVRMAILIRVQTFQKNFSGQLGIHAKFRSRGPGNPMFSGLQNVSIVADQQEGST